MLEKEIAEKFIGKLPYATELYGVYQPVLGWKSRHIKSRTNLGIDDMRNRTIQEIISYIQPSVVPNPEPRVTDVPNIGILVGKVTRINPILDSIVLQRVLANITQTEAGHDKPDVWLNHTNDRALNAILGNLHEDIKKEINSIIEFPQSASFLPRLTTMSNVSLRFNPKEIIKNIFIRESRVAGLLNYLNQTLADQPQQFKDLLKGLTSSDSNEVKPASLLKLLTTLNPRESTLMNAILSPIGVVHLFRQYFFEFESFLGPPVQHIWLSPGGTVELVESSTRKETIERTIESSIESMEKTEKSSMAQDELADAVKKENASNTKLGVSVSGSAHYGVPVFSAEIKATASYDMNSSQKEAREDTHKSLRQTTEKISEELRKSYKTTVKIVSETTDMTSRRYVIQNHTTKLVNYEIRRKMRQVGVQCQDYGTSLCWQTYVDNPGESIGISKLVHIAQPADLPSAPKPNTPPMPAPEIAGPPIKLHAQWLFGNNYQPPKDTRFEPFIGSVPVTAPQEGYIYSRSSLNQINGEPWTWDIRPHYETQENEKVATSLDIGVFIKEGTSLQTDQCPAFNFELIIYFKPSAALVKKRIEDITQAKTEYDDQKQRTLKEALYKAAQERVKMASQVQPRKFEDLREEERIIVYRKLIQQLIKGTGLESAQNIGISQSLHHIFAELIRSMFDVDKMLYFVAPEWWIPRQHYRQSTALDTPTSALGASQADFDMTNTTGWGGADEGGRDNYYITDDSTPAKLGSSLGWLLQLDGDNLRNAFLNAPWVKAVVPIRPEKEWEAVQWLTAESIEDKDGLNKAYPAASEEEAQTIVDVLTKYPWESTLPFKNDQKLLEEVKTRYTRPPPHNFKKQDVQFLDAIRYLIISVQRKHNVSKEKGSLSYLPTDEVYEKGFKPLEGGFTANPIDPRDNKPSHFKIFDQWVEVVPTDQVMAVEVECKDLSTGKLTAVPPPPPHPKGHGPM